MVQTASHPSIANLQSKSDPNIPQTSNRSRYRRSTISRPRNERGGPSADITTCSCVPTTQRRHTRTNRDNSAGVQERLHHRKNRRDPQRNRTSKAAEFEPVAAGTIRCKNGESLRELALVFRIHRRTVSDHFERPRVRHRGSVRQLTDQQCHKIAELYRSDKSLADLGSQFEVHPKTTSTELRKLGVPMRPQGKKYRRTRVQIRSQELFGGTANR